MACAALHNFIRINTNNSDLEIFNLESLVFDANLGGGQGLVSGLGSGNRSSNADYDDLGMKVLRDEIAEAMWRDYVNYKR